MRRALVDFLPRSTAAVTAVIAALTTIAGCGGAEPRQPAAPAHIHAAPAVPPAEPGPKDAVARAAVHRAIKAGLARFLALVDVEAVLGPKNRFIGWRIVELRGPRGTWDGVDLHVGDVLTRVNGFPIERDDQADKAFRALAVASEIRVSLLREGKATELRLAIVDGEPPPAAASASSSAIGATP